MPGGDADSSGTHLGALCEQSHVRGVGGESLAGLAIMAPWVIPVGHEQTVGIFDHHFLGVQNGITRAWGAGN